MRRSPRCRGALPGSASGIRRYQLEQKINEPITVINGAGDAMIETNVEVFEDVLAKIIMNT